MFGRGGFGLNAGEMGLGGVGWGGVMKRGGIS